MKKSTDNRKGEGEIYRTSEYPFTLPNYENGSIVNLMSSLANCYDKSHTYNELPSLPSKDLRQYQNIVLIVIDGLGYNYLQQQNGSYLKKHIKDKMTSVFLSTTACANTAFSVGYPSQQHALTGWDINLKEIGAITTILPFIPMFGGEELTKSDFKMNHIMDIPSFRKDFSCECFSLYNKNIADSPFTQYVSAESTVIPTNSYDDTFEKLKEMLNSANKKRRYFHTYIPDLDSSGHENGYMSSTTLDTFVDLDIQIEKLVKNVKSNTAFIVVADHGMIDCKPEEKLWIENFDGLKECLTIPLAGEGRVRDCFVRPGKVDDFLRIVKNQMSEYCWCYEGQQLIDDHLYGLGTPNKRLIDRVGDYVLIMKEHYTLHNRLANHETHHKNHIGIHAGVTPDEMFVPLILITS